MTTLETGTMLWLLPLIQLLSCLPALLGARTSRAWAIAEGSALTGIVIALGATVLAIWQSAFDGVRINTLSFAMVLLISVLGWVIVRFSRRYLHGESGQNRYISALMLTLSAVSIVPVTDHLGVLVLAWFASSITLHHLLTFYRNRLAAQIVAHKKFLASRLADLCLGVALVIIYRETATLSISGIADHVSGLTHLSGSLHGAMVLIAVAAILKSAQLPFHGWLIQVMEAPTPVSALLHAGVVNLGGFVLIRLATLLSAAPVAQSILVIIGSLTAVLAGLVMMTRISIKVRLAWSTCAQMGFMLMECGLGLFDLAFLHLVAHSLYKAHAFLTAGEAVLETRRRDLFPIGGSQSTVVALVSRLAAAPVAVLLVAGSTLIWQIALPQLDLSTAVILIVGLGLAPLLWFDNVRLAGAIRNIFTLLLVTQLYIAWHVVSAKLLGTPPSPTSIALTLWAAACFITLYSIQAWLISFPRGALSSALYPWAYAGFYLDERFTRLTFRVWPARMPGVVPHPSAHPPIGEKA